MRNYILINAVGFGLAGAVWGAKANHLAFARKPTTRHMRVF